MARDYSIGAETRRCPPAHASEPKPIQDLVGDRRHEMPLLDTVLAGRDLDQRLVPAIGVARRDRRDQDLEILVGLPLHQGERAAAIERLETPAGQVEA